MAYNDSMAGIGDAGKPEVETSAAIRQVLLALKHTGIIGVIPMAHIYMYGIAFVVVCLFPLMLLSIRYTWSGFQLDWLTWLLLLSPLAGIIGTVFLMRYTLRKINRFRLSIRERIEQSGLLERIAQGPGGLPDIFEYTAFPWRLMLGAKPRTLARWMQLVAGNIEWYLLAEPKPYMTREWYITIVSYCLIPLHYILMSVFIFSKGAASFNLPNVMIVVGMFPCMLLLFMSTGWLSLYKFPYMSITRKAFADIIRDRYGLQ